MTDIESSLPDLIRALPRRGDVVPAHYLSTPMCDVLFVSAPAGSSLPPHTHDTDNVTAVVSGETVLTTAAGEQRYRSGEWYQTSADELHGLRFEVDTVQVEMRFVVPSRDG